MHAEGTISKLLVRIHYNNIYKEVRYLNFMPVAELVSPQCYERCRANFIAHDAQVFRSLDTWREGDDEFFERFLRIQAEGYPAYDRLDMQVLSILLEEQQAPKDMEGLCLLVLQEGLQRNPDGNITIGTYFESVHTVYGRLGYDAINKLFKLDEASQRQDAEKWRQRKERALDPEKLPLRKELGLEPIGEQRFWQSFEKEAGLALTLLRRYIVVMTSDHYAEFIP